LGAKEQIWGHPPPPVATCLGLARLRKTSITHKFIVFLVQNISNLSTPHFFSGLDSLINRCTVLYRIPQYPVNAISEHAIDKLLHILHWSQNIIWSFDFNKPIQRIASIAGMLRVVCKKICDLRELVYGYRGILNLMFLLLSRLTWQQRV